MTSRPNAAAVLKRATALKSVVLSVTAAPPREILEQMPAAERAILATPPMQRRQAAYEALGPLQPALTPWEREYFTSSPDEITRLQQIIASWRVESLQILLWALRAVETFPAYDVQAKPAVLGVAPGLASDTPVRLPSLRLNDVIDEQREIAELWHWRARTRELMRSGQPLPDSPALRRQGLNSFDDIVRLAASTAAARGALQTIEGDFAWGGRAYRDLDDNQWSQARSISLERHLALNWLCGYAPNNAWDETPTDT